LARLEDDRIADRCRQIAGPSTARLLAIGLRRARDSWREKCQAFKKKSICAWCGEIGPRTVEHMSTHAESCAARKCSYEQACAAEMADADRRLASERARREECEALVLEMADNMFTPGDPPRPLCPWCMQDTGAHRQGCDLAAYREKWGL
jgi:hypothetical protein